MTVRTRFAPSPTGYLHIGGVRTALFAWLYARHHKGEFILRVEDTDRERSSREAVDVIIEGMAWLGLGHDEGPVYQTARFDRYYSVIQQLLNEDKAYHCYCSREELDTMRAEAMARGEKPKYNGKCRHRQAPAPENATPVVRFKNPTEGAVVVNDLIQGEVIFQNQELDDLIIARSDGSPTYNLTVVVDDMDMGITHVMRGDDHLNNTPRQINMFKALGADLPEFGHIPMILGPDGKKLSKRHGTVSVLQYRNEGYLPEALLNYLVRLGWSHGDQEIFSMEEMIQLFDIKDVNKAASAINPDKLSWLNQHYIKTGEPSYLSALASAYLTDAGLSLGEGPEVEQLIEVQKERVKTMTELVEQSRYFYEDFSDFDEKAAKKNLRPVVLEPMEKLRKMLADLTEWNKESLHDTLEKVASEFDMKLGKIAQPLRVAVTGGAVSPSIDDTVNLIGKERCLERLEKALLYIKQRAEA
jgi:glutamyl-tRNA synthetase